MYVENYTNHDNGWIWIAWDAIRVDIRYISSTSQMVHCDVFDLDGTFNYWLTSIYALNKLEQRRILWKYIEHIHAQQQGPWCLLGDFNNVAKVQDRVGVKMFIEVEYVNFNAMLEKTDLCEMDSRGDYYTWSNNQVEGTIYSRIDRVLRNVEWFQDHLDVNLNILPPSVYDHALLWLQNQEKIHLKRTHFKFTNYVVNVSGYTKYVSKSWMEPLLERPMYVICVKLKRLQSAMRTLSKPLQHLKQSILEARIALQKAQHELGNDRMNDNKIERVKRCTEDLINLNEIE